MPRFVSWIVATFPSALLVTVLPFLAWTVLEPLGVLPPAYPLFFAVVVLPFGPAVEPVVPFPAVELVVPFPAVELVVPFPAVELVVPFPAVELVVPFPAVELVVPFPAVLVVVPFPAVVVVAPRGEVVVVALCPAVVGPWLVVVGPWLVVVAPWLALAPPALPDGLAPELELLGALAGLDGAEADFGLSAQSAGQTKSSKPKNPVKYGAEKTLRVPDVFIAGLSCFFFPISHQTASRPATERLSPCR